VTTKDKIKSLESWVEETIESLQALGPGMERMMIREAQEHSHDHYLLSVAYQQAGARFAEFARHVAEG
jgi:hypothetical protein